MVNGLHGYSHAGCSLRSRYSHCRSSRLRSSREEAFRLYPPALPRWRCQKLPGPRTEGGEPWALRGGTRRVRTLLRTDTRVHKPAAIYNSYRNTIASDIASSLSLLNTKDISVCVVRGMKQTLTCLWSIYVMLR